MNALLIGLYGIVIIAGGLIGYAKAQSLPSLIMGGVFGLLLMFSSWGVHKKSKESYYLALGLSSFLTLFFLYRYWTTMAIMPGGIMAFISAVVALLLFVNREK